jgi:hypothetical protein
VRVRERGRDVAGDATNASGTKTKTEEKFGSAVLGWTVQIGDADPTVEIHSRQAHLHQLAFLLVV